MVDNERKISRLIIFNLAVGNNKYLLFANIFIVNYMFGPAIGFLIRDWSSNIALIISGVFLELLVFYFATKIVKNTIDYLKIYANGIQTEAIMVDAKENRIADSEHEIFTLTFEYNTDDGEIKRIETDELYYDVPQDWWDYIVYKNNKLIKSLISKVNIYYNADSFCNEEVKNDTQSKNQRMNDIIEGRFVPNPPKTKIIYTNVRKKHIAEFVEKLNSKYEIIENEVRYIKGASWFNISLILTFIIILLNIAVFIIKVWYPDLTILDVIPKEIP